MDKISFIRFQLISGSLAAEMMSSSSFNVTYINGKYSTFRENFLQTFGLTTDSHQWAFNYVDSLTSHLVALGHMRAQPTAAEFAIEALTALKASSFIENGSIMETSLREILEF